jgi:adenosylhomocysteine nucleosidase
MRSIASSKSATSRFSRLAVLLAFVLAGCSTGSAGRNASPSLASRADFTVVTVLDEEYDAMLRWLDEPREVDYAADRWTVGELRGQFGERPAPRVIVIATGEKGEVSAALATQSAIDHWHAPFVLLVGIAGGIEGSVSLGDLVVAKGIWDYDVGHLGESYEPDSTRFEPDASLLRAAREVPADWTRSMSERPPREGVVPRVVEAEVASGGKVIETSQSAFFSDVWRASPGFAAVEMEGAGVSAAIERAKISGDEVGFLMIRGISDLVGSTPHPEDEDGEVTRNPQRSRWREYAADAAASFAAELIRQHWRSAEPDS